MLLDREQEDRLRKSIQIDGLEYDGVVFGMGYLPIKPSNLEEVSAYFDEFEGLPQVLPWEQKHLGTKSDKRILYVYSVPGAPSFSVMCEWYFCHGPAQKSIGVGLAGSISDEIEIGDLVIPVKAISGEGTSKSYFSDISKGFYPDTTLATHIVKKAVRHGFEMRETLHPTVMYTTDAICAENEAFMDNVLRAGAKTVDMEVSALFNISRLHDKQTAALLSVSDRVDGTNPHWIDLEESTDITFNKAIKIATEVMLE